MTTETTLKNGWRDAIRAYARPVESIDIGEFTFYVRQLGALEFEEYQAVSGKADVKSSGSGKTRNSTISVPVAALSGTKGDLELVKLSLVEPAGSGKYRKVGITEDEELLLNEYDPTAIKKIAAVAKRLNGMTVEDSKND